jgi:hypothetical protein
MEVVPEHAVAFVADLVPPGLGINDIIARLRRGVPSESSWDFLAGIMTARGKAYVGATMRNGVPKYSPSLSVELSHDEAPLLTGLFGPPAKRGYYGFTTYRWMVQDRDTIVALCLIFAPRVPIRFGEQLLALARHCLAATPADRRATFIEFKATQGVTITTALS